MCTPSRRTLEAILVTSTLLASHGLPTVHGQCSYGWKPSGGSLPGMETAVYATAVYDDGTGPALYAAGGFSVAGGTKANYIAKWTGTAWVPLGNGPANGTDTWVRSLAVYNGELIAGGHFINAGGVSANYIARWNGTSWSPLGSGLGIRLNPVTPGIVAALLVHNGELIVAGTFGSAGGSPANNIAKWNGTTWSPLGTGDANGVNESAYALTVYNGDLVVGGSFTRAGGVSANGIARWTGTAWLPLGDGITGGGDYYSPPSVFAMIVQNNELIAGGNFTTAGGQPASGIARWDGSSWSPLGTGLQDEEPNYSDKGVRALALFNGELIAGGHFFKAGETLVSRIARWDGDSWSPLGSGLHGSGRTLLVMNDELIVGGLFDTAGSVEANCVARWNGSTWSAIGSGTDSMAGFITALEVYKGELIAAGRFKRFAGTDASNIARWDGASWQPLPGPNGEGVSRQVDALAVWDGELIAGGSFWTAGGVPACGIAKWNGSTWTAMNTGYDHGVTADVRALHVYNGDLIAGGDFDFYRPGLIGSYGAVKWDGTSWLPLAESPDARIDTEVYALAEYQGELIAGGRFSRAGGSNATTNNIARWDGVSWRPLAHAGQNGVNGEVNALAVFNGQLIVGGNFGSPGDISNIATWDGATWSFLGRDPMWNGVGGTVSALAIYEGDLIVGGAFRYALNKESPPLAEADFAAKWNGTTWSPLGTGPRNGTNDWVFALVEYEGDLVLGGRFELAGGEVSIHWARWGPVGPFVPADINHDCYVDVEDLLLFQACATGPAIPYLVNNLPPGCTLTPGAGGHLPADLDQDGDIDQADFGVMQRCYSGVGQTADPACDD